MARRASCSVARGVLVPLARDRTCVPCTARGMLNPRTIRKSPQPLPLTTPDAFCPQPQSGLQYTPLCTFQKRKPRPREVGVLSKDTTRREAGMAGPAASSGRLSGGGTACGPKPHPDPPAAPPLLCAGPGFPSSSHPPSGSVESRLTCLSPPWRCCVPSTRGWAQSSTPTDAEPPRQHVSPELGGATALPNTSAHDGPQVCVCVCVCV